MMRRAILGAFLALLVVFPAAAQDRTGTPIQDFYKDWIMAYTGAGTGVSTTTTTQLYDGGGNALPLELQGGVDAGESLRISTDGDGVRVDLRENPGAGNTWLSIGTAGAEFFGFRSSPRSFALNNDTYIYWGTDLILSRYDPTTTDERLEIDDNTGTPSDGTGTAGIIVGGGSATYPALGLGDGDTGLFEAADDFMNIAVGGSARFGVSVSNIYAVNANGWQVRNQASSRTSAGVNFDRADGDTGISGGAAGDDGEISLISDATEIARVTATELLLNKTLQHAVQGASVTATSTVTPTTSYVELTCTNGAGCAVTLSEAGAAQGDTLTIVDVSTNANTITDSAGVTELAGNWVSGQYDSLTLVYMSDRWVETSRSNN